MPTKGEKTAARILDAAEKLFAKRGYQATTLRDIADLVPLKQPSLYNHFATKQALYEAVLDRALQPLVDRIELTSESGADRSADVLPMAMMDLLSKHSAVSSLLFREMMNSEEPNVGARRWIKKMVSTTLGHLGLEGDQTDEFARLLANVNLIVGFFAVGPGLAKQSGIKVRNGQFEQTYRAMLKATVAAQETIVGRLPLPSTKQA